MPVPAEPRVVEDAHGEWSLTERLLRLPHELAGAEQPEDLVEAAAAALSQLLGAEASVYWADEEPHPPAALSPHRLRLVVQQQEVPYAAIELLHHAPFSFEAQRVAGHLAQDLSYVVDAITMRRIRLALGVLRTAARSGAGLEELTARAVELAVEHLGAEAGLMLLNESGTFEPLASVGEWPDDPAEHTWLQAVAAAGVRTLGARRHGDRYFTAPIASSCPARWMLVVRFACHRRRHSVTFPLLNEIAAATAPYLDASWRDRVLSELLELNCAGEETTSEELYQRVLDTALRLVPGADSGTLLTRASPEEPFRYQAARGFDLAGLRERPLAEAEARAWYGPDEEGWRRGLPRILSSNDTDITRLGWSASPHADLTAKTYHRIRSTLCLPVLRDGHVMAVLNLDNLTDPEGLAADSSQLAHLFGAPLASLLHRQQTRELLRKAALTDDLTGLGNRRAFDAALERELARAARGGPPPSVLLMDLKDFKLINDRFGHDVGDEALVAVARELRASLRATDLPARRGGDEFVALLVDTPAAQAAEVAARVKRAVARVRVADRQLRANVGTATAGVDGDDAAELLALADQRMYQDKHAGRGTAAPST